jgi:CTP synthase
MTKYIFVTGGVVSGLGKGIVAASVGRLLKQRGLVVANQKLDPYLNIDPGTMSPFQHGEVYVTDDGAETDLDLGHYERFTDVNLNKYSNITSGKVYNEVLTKERRGEYLGHTVQIIPHVTDEINSFIYKIGIRTGADVVITEIGGTTGDIEGLPYLEAIRQISNEVGRDNCLFMHVTLVPFIDGSNEYKSKPTQHSVKELQGLGLAPNIILCRSATVLPESTKKKIAMFCNVKEDCVIDNTTVSFLYEAPLMLEEEHLSEIICRELNIKSNPLDMSEWTTMCDSAKKLCKTVKIALVGKYVELHDAYLSVAEALCHAGLAHGVKVDIDWVASDGVTVENVGQLLKDADGVIVPGGFGERGVEGMIATAKYCRENDVPYYGICLGMQVMLIEFFRGAVGFADAHSSEFCPKSTHKVIALMEEQAGVDAKGGTMRLGAYPCCVGEGTLLREAYNEAVVSERHRHRYEFNMQYRTDAESHGGVLSGISPDGRLVEAFELKGNRFHVGVQYHPEFKSRPNKPHPLFSKFIEKSIL